MKSKKILILSRKYPPSVGGMQAYTKNFIRRMEDIYRVDKIVLGKEQVNLIWFLPYLFVRSAAMLARGDYDLLYLCDALLAPLGAALKKMFGIAAAVTVHGLDITFDRFFYQNVVPGAVAGFDRVVCVSANTLEECVKRGIPEDKCTVIPNGIEPDEHKTPSAFDESAMRTLLGEGAPDGKKILLTVGRLVRRKGIDWFVENVIPRLDDDFVYLVAGEGSERENIERTVKKSGMEERVRLLGRVSNEDLGMLYDLSYALVLPNQKVDRDPEGFGIVAIEAASCGLPVIANKVDGIMDAVLDGQTGHLVDYNDAGVFAQKIRGLDLDRSEVEKSSMIFSWENLAPRYEKVIDAI